MELTDSTGNVVQTYVYDSFGNIVLQSGALENPFTYTGREFDSETGLYFYRARYYDPSLGRFLQEDPIGFQGGDINIYAYVGNNPINFIDSYGLAKCDCKPCDECPSGIWSGAGFSAFLQIYKPGGSNGIYLVSCLDSNITCIISILCGGVGLGGGLAIEGIVFKGACSRGDLNGKTLGADGFAGKGIGGLGGGFTTDKDNNCVNSFSFGGGISWGAGFMGSYCETKVKFCF